MNLIFQTLTRRICILENEGPAQCRTVANALACFIGPGSGNSKASTSNQDNRIAATGLANVQQGSSVKATDDAIVVKDGSKILAPGATENSGTITVTGASDDTIKTALQTVADVADQATTAAQSGQTQLTGLLSTAVSKLAEKTTKEGEDARNKNLLFMVLGIFVLLGFIFRKKF